MRKLLLALILLFAAPAWATTYYMSPTGDDGNNGLTSGAPKKTFAHTLQLLSGDDVVILLDGTWDGSGGTDLPNIAGAGYNSGTDGHPITIRAANERKAILNGKGTTQTFTITSKDYWTIEGLYIRADDDEAAAANFYATSADHITVKRCVFAYANRHLNGALARFELCEYPVMEECEGYYFHRVGFVVDGCSHSRIRRCYLNSKAYADIPGHVSSPTSRGDEAFTIYNWTAGGVSHDNIFENCISEKTYEGFLMQTPEESIDDKFLGCISISDDIGFYIGARNDTGHYHQPVNTQLTNCISLDPGTANHDHGFDFREPSNVTALNCSYLGSGTGFTTASNATPTVSLYWTNCLAVSQNNDGYYGFIIGANTDTYLVDYTNAYNFYGSLEYSPACDSTYVTHCAETDPALGSVKLYIPAGSAMSGIGSGGADKGANIKYRYIDGTLTGAQLFVGGKFPKGAVITGLNDQASTIYDVEDRLGTLPTYASNSGGMLGIIAESPVMCDPVTSIRRWVADGITKGSWSVSSTTGNTLINLQGKRLTVK